jgi:vitamin B12 transporter
MNHHLPLRHAVPRRYGAVFLLLFSASGFAQSTTSIADAVPNELDPVVVTATRIAQPLSNALPATTVITRADIDDSRAPDLATLLRGQAGFDVSQSGGLGGQTSLFLRGSNSNQVLVLIDGLRVNTTSSGLASVAHLMVDQIDHIEIVRGNVSSIYGSEAIGGVIQIFTRAGSTGGSSSIDAGLTYGSERNRAASVDASQSFGPADAQTHVGVSASYRAAKGFSAIDADRVAAANPDYDGYRNDSVSALVSQRFGEQKIGARYFESRGHLDFDESTDYSFIDPTYDGRVQTQQERSRQNDASLYGRFKLASFWNVDALIGRSRDLSVNTASFPDSFVIGSTVSTDTQYRLVNTFRLADHAVTLGYEHLDQSGFSTSYGDGIEGATYARDVNSEMIGYTGPLLLPSGVNEFQLDARHDRYSDFGNATTGLAAYGLTFAQGWKAIVQGSTAFKAPVFNELYFPYYGNPDLKPERARTVEAALQYSGSDGLARLSVFRTKTHDLIVSDPITFLANNIDRARVNGVELTGRTVVAGFTVIGSATFERPIDETTEQPLLRRANHNFGLSVAKSYGRFRFTADAEAAGRRFDSDIVTFDRTTLAGYAIANFGVRYEILHGLTAGFALNNAFDRRYEQVDGYNSAGRVALFTVGARY